MARFERATCEEDNARCNSEKGVFVRSRQRTFPRKNGQRSGKQENGDEQNKSSRRREGERKQKSEGTRFPEEKETKANRSLLSRCTYTSRLSACSSPTPSSLSCCPKKIIGYWCAISRSFSFFFDPQPKETLPSLAAGRKKGKPETLQPKTEERTSSASSSKRVLLAVSAEPPSLASGFFFSVVFHVAISLFLVVPLVTTRSRRKRRKKEMRSSSTKHHRPICFSVSFLFFLHISISVSTIVLDFFLRSLLSPSLL